MMDVYWLEQVEADVPAANNWLSPDEILHFNGLRIPKRRADWRLGRWTAKRAVAFCLNISDHPRSLADIEIRAAKSGAPEVFLAHQPVVCTVSLSHCSGRAVCALVPPPAVALGCDLERIEPRSPGFIADYFTPEEQSLIERSLAKHRFALLTLLWSGKESALKALHVGLRLDTRSVNVEPECFPCGVGGWHPFRVHYFDDKVFRGWCEVTDDLVRTLVSSPRSKEPVRLQNLTCRPGRHKEVTLLSKR